MRHKLFLIVGLIMLMTAVAVTFVQAQLPVEDNHWQEKVDAWVLQTADPALAAPGEGLPQTEFLVVLAEQGDVSGADALFTKEEKGQYVYETLMAVARRTQPALINQLELAGVPYRQFWVVNMIWVQGDMDLVRQMAHRDDVAHIAANPTVKLDLLPTTKEQMQRAIESVEWNITHVGAPTLWSSGVTGQGVVIAGQDTGYRWDHVALINQYRGWDGATADHDYNWHDAIHSSSGACPGDSPAPCDDYNHGTHTMGTMVGNDLDPANPNWPAGATNAIGMAPGAQWIGCRNMDQGNGTPATYSECYEFFIAPYPIGGDPFSDGDPTKAPHVINNSWGCPGSEGCNANSLLAVVQNVVAAGIVTVHSAGNSGSSCNTVNTPAGIYDESYTVGATNSGDTIAGFSSRGVVTVDGSNRMKPDISAPGVAIRSSIRNGGYQGGSSWSGTSMAAPHVAGQVALVIAAEPQLAGQVDAIESLINQTAVPRTTSQGCGGDSPTDVPNNVYGHGRIDALAAYNGLGAFLTHQLTISKTVAVPMIYAGQTQTYTLQVVNQHPFTPTYQVVITDVIPAGSSLITATMPYTFNGAVVTWNVSSLDAAVPWQADLAVQSWLTTTLPQLENNDYGVRSNEVITTVLGTPVHTPMMQGVHLLDVQKTGPTAATAGDDITYTLSVSHQHPVVGTTNVVLTDVVPAGSSFVTATLPHTFDGTMVRWDNPAMNQDELWQVDLVVGTAVTLPDTLLVNEHYGVRSDDVLTTAVGQPVTTTIHAIPVSHTLTISKTAVPQTIRTGDRLTYTLSVQHLHPHLPTTNVVLTDVLPANTFFITATMPYTFDGTMVRWDVSTIAAGDTWEVMLIVGTTPTYTTGLVENVAYGVRSDDVLTVMGTAVTVPILPTHQVYLPFILQE